MKQDWGVQQDRPIRKFQARVQGTPALEVRGNLLDEIARVRDLPELRSFSIHPASAQKVQVARTTKGCQNWSYPATLDP